MRLLVRKLVILFWMMLLLLSFCMIMVPSVVACDDQALSGRWVSAKGQSRALVEVELMRFCSKVPRKRSGPIKGADWTARAWHKCAPSNCLWGREEAVYDQLKDQFTVTYETFFAVRTLTLMPMDPDTGMMRADYRFVFRDTAKGVETGTIVLVRKETY